MTGSKVPSFIVLVYLFSSCFLTGYSIQDICIASDGASKDFPLCITLNEFCNGPSSTSNGVNVTLLNGTHWLNTTCNLEFIEGGLILRGEGGPRPVVVCSPDNGFKFLNVTNLKISDVDFRGCGFNSNIMLPSLDLLHYNNTLTALMFVNGSNLSLTNVTVSQSSCWECDCGLLQG